MYPLGVPASDLFQSTRPLGGATFSGENMAMYRFGFNPRAPWGARQSGTRTESSRGTVSIHAPPGGRDRQDNQTKITTRWFQSTRPLGGATTAIRGCNSAQLGFNPRAPWGARRIGATCQGRKNGFQSTRPLGGATLRASRYVTKYLTFQSTRPLGGATKSIGNLSQLATVSIHAPPGGRDNTGLLRGLSVEMFQSTRPLGGATHQCA